VTPPTVLIDETFLAALGDADHEWHAVAVELYGMLVDEYERDEVRLRARTDHLRRHPEHRRTLFAPIESMSVARQYERAGAALKSSADVSADVAVTLVMMKREKIRRIATLDPAFSEFEDVEVVRRATSRTELPSAPRSTDE
jgi:predicted nucleic acid-binding protein